ncbi:MAG: PAS domain S-box protein [Pirellulales bacterium]|nr:PAS domain S-box protein [Pirellulales bacterium]
MSALREKPARAALDYIAALAIVAAALILRLALDSLLGGRRPYLTLFGGVALAIWLTRWKPAAVAALVGFVAANFFVAAPQDGIVLNSFFFVELAVYSLSAGLIILGGEALHRARERVEREAAERGTAEESERRQKELLRVTFASIGDAVITTDAAGRLTFLNAVAESLTGWMLREAVGQPLGTVFRIVNEQTRLPVEDPATKALQAGTIVGLANHTVLISKGGGERPIDDSAAPIRDREGRVVGCVLIFRDITERRRLEHKLVDDTARVQSIVNNVVDGIIAIDERGTVVAFNPAAKRIFGYSEAEAVGQNVKSLMPEPFHSEHDGYLASYLRTGQAKIIGIGREVAGRRKDGGTFPMELAVSEYWLGERRYFTGIVRDITARKKAEARQRLLLDAAALLLHAEDPDAMLHNLFSQVGPHLGLDTYFNYLADQPGETLRLVSSAGIPEGSLREVSRLEYGQAICGAVAQFRQPIVATQIQQSDDPKAQLVKSLGVRAYACNPLLADGKLLGTLSFGSRSRDEFDADELELLSTLSHYVAVAYERLRLVRELQEADQRKDKFLATLAHELRGPLAPLSNMVEVMKRAEGDGGMIRQAQDMIDRQLKQLIRLVDDLLDVSRISSDKLELRLEDLDLTPIVQQAVETCRPLAREANHALHWGAPREPILVRADAARLMQVFGNLLGNACKYTPAGGQIWVAVERQGSDAVVSVKDTGVGIPADMLQRVFEMFTQVDRTLDRSQLGLGIGLSLVKRLVEMHGGSVSAASGSAGKGAEFTVQLPIIVGSTTAAQPRKQQNAPQPTGLRVLVVDDNQDSAASLAMLLKIRGNETAVAHDGSEAVEKAERFAPDMVLLDLGLPKLDGYEAARQIRQHPWGRQMMLVALTGWGQDEDRRKSREAGFDHHLVKPVDHNSLMILLDEQRQRQV